MKHILFCAVLTTLIAVAAPRAHAGESCELVTESSAKALDELHDALDEGGARRDEVVARWLAPIGLALAGDNAQPWVHAAVDLGRLLMAVGRRDEARHVFQLTVAADREGKWREKAQAHLRELEGE